MRFGEVGSEIKNVLNFFNKVFSKKCVKISPIQNLLDRNKKVLTLPLHYGFTSLSSKSNVSGSYNQF